MGSSPPPRAFVPDPRTLYCLPCDEPVFIRFHVDYAAGCARHHAAPLLAQAAANGHVLAALADIAADCVGPRSRHSRKRARPT